MSVFYDNHGRDNDYENHGVDPSRARWSPFDSRRQPPPRARHERGRAPLWGLSFERAEGVIQLVLAFALVGGATAVLNSSLFGASPTRAPVKAAALSTPIPTPLPPPKAAAPRPAPAVPVSTPSAPVAAPAPQVQSVPSAPVQGAPRQAASAQAATSRAASVPASFFDARPIADRASMEPEQAPRPLAPPSPEAREKLAVQSASPASPPTEVAAAEALPVDAKTASARAVGAETGAADNGRLTKCYLKLAGKRHENSDCRIRQLDDKVVFEFVDKSLVFTRERGRVWTATMGARSFGKVYQNVNKPCWGTRGSGFFACDNT